MVCSLRVETGESDTFWYVESLSEVKPGARFSLFYTGVPQDYRRARRGPTYSWRGDGTLADRYWKDEKRNPEYMYYRSGRLFRYISGGPVAGLESLDELFARNGMLIACHFDSGRGQEYWWAGRRVESEEYYGWALESQRRALK